MKKLSLKLLILIAVMALGIASCKKSNETSQSRTDAQVMADFMQQNGPKSESFTVDAAAGATVTTTKGTKLHIPAGAFVRSNGQVVTGSVAVAVKEILGVSDMILGDKPTLTADGKLLISFGEFYVKAAQNNEELKLKKDSAIRIQVQAKNGAGGRQEVPMWGGDSSITTTLSGYTYLNLPITITSTITVKAGVKWEQNGSYAFFNSTNGSLDFRLDSLGHWINCDALSNDPGPKTTVMGYFSNHFNASTGANYSGEQPSMLFFKPQGRNTLIKLYNVILNAPAGKEGLHSYQTSMPIGLNGTFLAMSTIDGKFYAEMKDAAVGTPEGLNNYTTITFNLQEVSQSTMLSMITQMNAK
jgi:hypothetical protein